MVCCKEGISKYIIIGLNIIFMVLGLAVMVPGIVMLTNIDFLSGNIEPLLDKISFNGINLSNIANNLPIIFIIVGASILFIATLGLVGACCKIKTLLVLYALIVIVLALVQVIILAFFFLLRTQLDDTIKDEFLSQLQSSYTKDDLDKSDEVSSAFNYMFMQMECCGVNPVTATTNDFDLTPWRSGDGVSLKIPKGCCIGVTEDTYSAFVNTACTDTATSGTYHSDGCYDAIMSSFGSTLDMMGYICLGALLLQILIVIFTFCLCCTYMKSGTIGVRV
ncbi:CD63 antigen-like isoform X1 [Mizuhopecten yessoensis]|uniref:CD63 antigen-like isoform X1 n=1 Tax=Mizuhopecten yessoensis TaxID=6573 RepID=UPI000B45B57F|nr:CD63 antigen-like isoform X1 [Mizuhopecten yessoensis]